MKFRISGLLAIAAFVVSCLLGSVQTFAQNAYIPNAISNDVSVIDTVTNTVIATIPVGNFAWGVGVDRAAFRASLIPSGRRASRKTTRTPPARAEHRAGLKENTLAEG
jgi:YVTN family beta-propeller protein